MTTKTDNYRETAEQLRSEDKLCEPEGDCPHCCELRLKMRGADAIEALIKERDALRDALRMHMLWIGSPPIDRYSADSLREDAWKLGVELIGNPRAALANAPTPNDKGK